MMQSIALENLCSRVSAYLYIGASVQMAYSLGMHRDQVSDSGNIIEREQNRRIWWTLFMLDQEIASRGGSPAVIDERYVKVTTPMASEQVSNPSVPTEQSIIGSRFSSLDYTHLFPGRPSLYLYVG
jgi:hypothetical protein